MIHMDGQQPSGFTKSKYRGYTDPAGAQDFKVTITEKVIDTVKKVKEYSQIITKPIGFLGNKLINIFKKKK